MSNWQTINKNLYAVEGRQINIDLLRALSAIFVVFEHFCESDAHNAFGFSYETSIVAYVTLHLLYSIARVAVPVFFILSGYCSINSANQKLGKVVNLFFMTIGYSLIPPLVGLLYNKAIGKTALYTISISNFLARNYYLYLFCAIYLISPFINTAITKLSKKQYRRLIIILVSLFSCWSTFINTMIALKGTTEITGVFFTSRTGTSMGFNVANFLTLYLIGGYFNMYHEINITKDRAISVVVILTCSITTVVCKLFFPIVATAFWYYDSVFVIASACAVVRLFQTLNVKSSHLILIMARSTFGTFLLHGFVTSIFEKALTVEHVVSNNGFLGTLAGMSIFVFGVYFVTLLVNFIIQYMITPINAWWKNTRLYNIKILPLN